MILRLSMDQAESEERLGRYIARRPEALIATKVGMKTHSGHLVPYDFSKGAILSSLNSSLWRLKVDSVFLLQLHSPPLGFQDEFSDIFEVLNEILSSGKAQNIGISLRSPELWNQQHVLFDWQGIQFNLSILDQRIRHQENIKNTNSFRIARTPLNFGFLTESPPTLENLSPSHHLRGWGRNQFDSWTRNSMNLKSFLDERGLCITKAALRFPIDSRLSDVIIPGARNLAELTSNYEVFNSEVLEHDIVRQLHSSFDDTLVNKIAKPQHYFRSSSDETF